MPSPEPSAEAMAAARLLYLMPEERNAEGLAWLDAEMAKPRMQHLEKNIAGQAKIIDAAYRPRIDSVLECLRETDQLPTKRGDYYIRVHVPSSPYDQLVRVWCLPDESEWFVDGIRRGTGELRTSEVAGYFDVPVAWIGPLDVAVARAALSAEETRE